MADSALSFSLETALDHTNELTGIKGKRHRQTERGDTNKHKYLIRPDRHLAAILPDPDPDSAAASFLFLAPAPCGHPSAKHRPLPPNTSQTRSDVFFLN